MGVSRAELLPIAKRPITWVGQVIVYVILIICSAAGVATQIDSTGSPLTSRLHAFLRSISDGGQFSGTVLIRKYGKTIYEESFGFADYENQALFTTGSRFEIASVTKTFTAAAILRLRYERKLSLDDKLSKYLPEFPNANLITIRHLLSHSSGVGELPGTWSIEEHPLAEVINGIAAQPFFFTPGKDERYSNSGFILLSAVIEKVTGKSYDGYLSETLFAPLGMKETGNYSIETIVSGRVHKYQPGPPPALVWNVAQQSLSSTLGAGSTVTSAADLALWAQAIRENRIFTQLDGEYPYGWHRDTFFGHKVLLQSGLHDGASALVETFPADQIDVVYLSNVQTGFFNDAAKDIAAILFDEPLQTPAQLGTRTLTNGQLQAWVGTYRANDRLEFQLQTEGKSLLFRWTDQTKSSYVRPTSDTSLFLPIEGAELTIENSLLPTGSVQAIRWKSSFDELHFVRKSSK